MEPEVQIKAEAEAEALSRGQAKNATVDLIREFITDVTDTETAEQALGALASGKASLLARYLLVDKFQLLRTTFEACTKNLQDESALLATPQDFGRNWAAYRWISACASKISEHNEPTNTRFLTDIDESLPTPKDILGPVGGSHFWTRMKEQKEQDEETPRWGLAVTPPQVVDLLTDLKELIGKFTDDSGADEQARAEAWERVVTLAQAFTDEGHLKMVTPLTRTFIKTTTSHLMDRVLLTQEPKPDLLERFYETHLCDALVHHLISLDLGLDFLTSAEPKSPSPVEAIIMATALRSVVIIRNSFLRMLILLIPEFSNQVISRNHVPKVRTANAASPPSLDLFDLEACDSKAPKILFQANLKKLWEENSIATITNLLSNKNIPTWLDQIQKQLDAYALLRTKERTGSNFWKATGSRGSLPLYLTSFIKSTGEVPITLTEQLRLDQLGEEALEDDPLSPLASFFQELIDLKLDWEDLFQGSPSRENLRICLKWAASALAKAPITSSQDVTSVRCFWFIQEANRAEMQVQLEEAGRRYPYFYLPDLHGNLVAFRAKRRRNPDEWIQSLEYRLAKEIADLRLTQQQTGAASTGFKKWHKMNLGLISSTKLAFNIIEITKQPASPSWVHFFKNVQPPGSTLNREGMLHLFGQAQYPLEALLGAYSEILRLRKLLSDAVLDARSQLSEVKSSAKALEFLNKKANQGGTRTVSALLMRQLLRDQFRKETASLPAAGSGVRKKGPSRDTMTVPTSFLSTKEAGGSLKRPKSFMDRYAKYVGLQDSGQLLEARKLASKITSFSIPLSGKKALSNGPYLAIKREGALDDPIYTVIRAQRLLHHLLKEHPQGAGMRLDHEFVQCTGDNCELVHKPGQALCLSAGLYYLKQTKRTAPWGIKWKTTMRQLGLGTGKETGYQKKYGEVQAEEAEVEDLADLVGPTSKARGRGKGKGKELAGTFLAPMVESEPGEDVEGKKAGPKARAPPSTIYSFYSRSDFSLRESPIHGIGVFTTTTLHVRDFLMVVQGEPISTANHILLKKAAREDAAKEGRAPIYSTLPLINWKLELPARMVKGGLEVPAATPALNGRTSYLRLPTAKRPLTDSNFNRFTSYLNHSCKPNCELRIVSYDGTLQAMLVALRLIKPNEELTVAYPWDPFEQEPMLNHCNCQAEGCVKVVGYGAFLAACDQIADRENLGEQIMERLREQLKSASVAASVPAQAQVENLVMAASTSRKRQQQPHEASGEGLIGFITDPVSAKRSKTGHPQQSSASGLAEWVFMDSQQAEPEAELDDFRFVEEVDTQIPEASDPYQQASKELWSGMLVRQAEGIAAKSTNFMKCLHDQAADLVAAPEFTWQDASMLAMALQYQPSLACDSTHEIFIQKASIERPWAMLDHYTEVIRTANAPKPPKPKREREEGIYIPYAQLEEEEEGEEEEDDEPRYLAQFASFMVTYLEQIKKQHEKEWVTGEARDRLATNVLNLFKDTEIPDPTEIDLDLDNILEDINEKARRGLSALQGRWPMMVDGVNPLIGIYLSDPNLEKRPGALEDYEQLPWELLDPEQALPGYPELEKVINGAEDQDHLLDRLALLHLGQANPWMVSRLAASIKRLKEVGSLFDIWLPDDNLFGWIMVCPRHATHPDLYQQMRMEGEFANREGHVLGSTCMGCLHEQLIQGPLTAVDDPDTILKTAVVPTPMQRKEWQLKHGTNPPPVSPIHLIRLHSFYVQQTPIALEDLLVAIYATRAAVKARVAGLHQLEIRHAKGVRGAEGVKKETLAAALGIRPEIISKVDDFSKSKPGLEDDDEEMDISDDDY